MGLSICVCVRAHVTLFDCVCLFVRLFVVEKLPRTSGDGVGIGTILYATDWAPMTANRFLLTSIEVVHLKVVIAITAVGMGRVVETTVQHGGRVPGQINNHELIVDLPKDNFCTNSSFSFGMPIFWSDKITGLKKYHPGFQHLNNQIVVWAADILV